MLSGLRYCLAEGFGSDDFASHRPCGEGIAAGSLQKGKIAKCLVIAQMYGCILELTAIEGPLSGNRMPPLNVRNEGAKLTGSKGPTAVSLVLARKRA